ncbi:MAG TPA: DUF2062 domain-containing protein [Porticoccaceae bacterium]|nr:DUF2062 domain-containing protein [Porticoccaceae bacterium]
MPRKTIHRFVPNMAQALEKPSLRWLKSLMRDPNLLHINRRSVSLAVYIGILSAFFPIPGQTLVAVFMCLWLGGNLPIAGLVIWISNPLTMPPMFYLTYRLGSFLLDTEAINFTVSLSFEWFRHVGAQILLPLMVGSLLSGLILATLGYLLVLQLWRWKVLQNWEKRNIERLQLIHDQDISD